MSFVHDDPDFPELLRIVAERRGLGVALVLDVPAATVRLDATGDASYHANFHVDYPGQHVGNLASIFRPFVLLELGSARVIPHVSRDMTSFVHEHLERESQLGDFEDNRPRAVRCVHPVVTLLEKLDALMRRLSRSDRAPATFVRHFEDGARIAKAAASLPALAATPPFALSPRRCSARSRSQHCPRRCMRRLRPRTMSVGVRSPEPI